MRGDLRRSWWVLVLRGLLAIAFGLLCFTLPRFDDETIALTFGLYVLVDGVFSIVAATLWQVEHPWWSLLLRGVLGIATGALILTQEEIAPAGLLLMIGAWAIISGLLESYAAMRLRDDAPGEWMLALAGVASVVFGILLVSGITGALAVLGTIGAYAVLVGLLLIATGMKLRSSLHGGAHPKALHRTA